MAPIRCLASGAAAALDADLPRSRATGDRAYCAEELVAEIASAFLSAELGVTQDKRADHAQYLGQWLELMKEDSRAIFTAAARASEAVSYLKLLQSVAKGGTG